MTTEEHLISCLGEEGVEVALELAKVCSKANRFGPDDRNVLDPTGPTNVERLVDELNDLLAVVGLLMESGVVPYDWQNDEKQAAKRAKVRKFLGYAEDRGRLTMEEKIARLDTVTREIDAVLGDDQVKHPVPVGICSHCGDMPVGDCRCTGAIWRPEQKGS